MEERIRSAIEPNRRKVCPDQGRPRILNMMYSTYYTDTELGGHIHMYLVSQDACVLNICPPHFLIYKTYISWIGY